MSAPTISTLGALRASGYQPSSIKDELRRNLIQRIRDKETIFPGILGFDDTVLPDVERALLSRHSIYYSGSAVRPKPASRVN